MAGLIVGLAVVCWFPAEGPSPKAADALTLRDGKVVLGQVLDSERRGPLLMVVRRAWAEKNLPEKLASWEKLESPQTRRAEIQRRERLEAWKRERRPDPAGPDRIAPWIESELTRLSKADANQKSTLMTVKIGRTEVKAIDRKSRSANRLLRLGWICDFPDVEIMSSSELAQGLEGRGFSAGAETPVSIDNLLPLPLEDDARWLIRRAATEIQNDQGGRLLRYQGILMAEPAPGEAPPAGAALNVAIGSLKELLGGEAPVDPLPGKLRELAGQGRVGAVVTRLEMSPDLSSTMVESTLWVRFGERWNPAVVRSSTVKADDLPPNAGAGIADDPQVKAVFGLVQSLGLGDVPPEVKRRTLNMGAATRQALGLAKGALDQELNSAALPIESVRNRVPQP